MSVVTAPAGPTHELGDTHFTSLATPSRGSRETSVWIAELDPGAQAEPHSLTREEIFVVLSGQAKVSLDGQTATVGAPDAIVVPAGVTFSLGNAGATPLRLLCCMAVGGQARLAGGILLTPPWTQ